MIESVLHAMTVTPPRHSTLSTVISYFLYKSLLRHTRDLN